jgi:hypothetical protein
MMSIRVSTSPSTDIADNDSLTASLASYSWSNELVDDDVDKGDDKGPEDDDETEQGDENG